MRHEPTSFFTRIAYLADSLAMDRCNSIQLHSNNKHLVVIVNRSFLLLIVFSFLFTNFRNISLRVIAGFGLPKSKRARYVFYRVTESAGCFDCLCRLLMPK